MRRVMTVLCITAVIVLVASATRALATSGDIEFDNQFGPGSNDPHAAAMGCIWINTGNGVLFKVPDLAVENGDGFPPPASDCAWDLNIELLGGTTPTNLARLVASPNQAPSTFTSLLLKDIPFGDGSTNTPNCGQYDTAFSAYPGEFLDSSQAYVYNVPGTTSGTDYFVLRAWTGDFTSYSAAVAGGALVGTTPVFANAVAFGVNPIPDLVGMPALILSPAPTPEPSTLFLAGVGMAGLLAYAWKKRK